MGVWWPGAGAMQRDFGVAGGAGAFMGRHLGDPVAERQRGHDHLHFNRGMARTQVKPAKHLGADGAKPVLRVRQAAAKPPVDQVGDKGGSGQAEKLVAASVELVGTAELAGAGYMIRPSGLDRRDEEGD